MFANHIGWSDITPYEVIRQVGKTGKTLEIRRMKYTLTDDWKPEIIVGGFFGRCVNQQAQEWAILPDENNPVERIRLSKDGVWRNRVGARFVLHDEPIRFYDHNF